MNAQAKRAFERVFGFLNAHAVSILLMLFTIVMLPATYTASRSEEEIATFSMDEMLSIPNIRNLSHGSPPHFYVYGNFPAFFAVTLFSPYLIVNHFAQTPIGFTQLALMARLAQLAMGVLGLLFLYLLSREFLSRSWAIASLLLAMSSTAYCEWTLTLHPDVHQGAMILAGIYFLVRFGRGDGDRALYLSALFGGFATASKYWGIFILVPAFSAIWLGGGDGGNGKKLSRSAWYAAIVIGVFLFIDPSFVVNTKGLLQSLKTHERNYPVLGATWGADLLKLKLSIVTSPAFFGTGIFLAYLPLFFRALWKGIRQGVEREPMMPLHLMNLTLFAYFFPFFNDRFNLPDSERYLIGFVLLFPIPVLSFLERSLKVPSRRRLGLAAVGLLAFSQGLRVFAIPAHAINMGQGDLFGLKEVRSIPKTLASYYGKETLGTFLVRDWLTRYVAPHSTLYVESYLNVPSDENKYPLGTIYRDYNIVPERVAEVRPDFVLTKASSKATLIASRFGYRRVALLGEGNSPVYVLERGDRRISSDEKTARASRDLTSAEEKTAEPPRE